MAHDHRGKSSETRLDKDAILKQLNIVSGQVIVDAGCGNGYMSKQFSRLVKNTGKVYALDTDEEAIETLKEQTERTNIEAIVADITKTTVIKGGAIDLIYLSTVFHGFSRRQIDGFQKEAKRLLKRDARLAILEIEKEETPFGPPLDIRFSPQELKERITLAPKDLVQVGQHFYMQIFENVQEE